ncbi:hypothetical protein [Enterobacter sp.]|nr:hypothetical protein [Enterobacter sp.]
MTLEQRLEALEKEINKLRKQLADYQTSTSCQIDALRSGIQNVQAASKV